MIICTSCLLLGCSDSEQNKENNDFLSLYELPSPIGWETNEIDQQTVEVINPEIKDANGVFAKAYIMRIMRPENWDYQSDADGLPEEFSDYRFISKGKKESNGERYRWIEFEHTEGNVRYHCLNAIIEENQFIVTTSAFSDTDNFKALRKDFEKIVFGIRMKEQP